MISRAETGLSVANYAALQAATGNLAVQIKLQRYGPVWASHDNGPGGSGENFDAALASTYAVWVYVSGVSTIDVKRLPDESGGDESWTSITCTTLTDIDTDVPISLITSGLTARIFYYTTDGKIKYSECADITTDAFGAVVEVGTVASVTELAAVSTTKVYYVTKNSNNNRVFHVYEYNGSWSSTSSDIYWPFPIYGFDAVAYTDFDLLMMSAEMSPLLGSRAIGTEVTTEANRVQGLVTFRVKNGRWSDHDVVDVIDKVETDPARDNLRLSFVNSVLFATYTRCGGADDHTYSKLAVARSKDGLNWEFPELLETITAPAVILPRTDYLYNVGIAKVMRSPCCAWAGQTPAELDVTDYVVSIDSQAAEIRNSSAAVSNPAGALNSTLARSDDRVQIVHDLGYVVSGSPLRITVSTEDVMSWSHSKRLPHQGLSLASQDRLGRLNRTTADYAAEWPSQQAGRDTYDDPTGTGYGGMRHTAPYDGSWKTPKDSPNEIHLKSSNKEGIAVSTFVTDALNGSDQTAFKLHTDSEGEHAGPSFRVFDKDNLFFVAYYLDSDVIKLVKGVGGTDTRDDTVLATSSSMSWVKNTWYWLKVRVRYSLVYVYYSTDGITWTLLSTGDFSSGYAEMAGTPDLDEAWFEGGRAIAWSGKFGLIGYGYSDDDTGPDWEPTPWIPFEPYVPQHWGMLVQSYTHLARAWNFFTHTDTTVWEDITGAMAGDKLIHIALGPSRQAYAVTDVGVYYTGNITAASPTWASLKTKAQARTDTGHAASEFRSVCVGPDGTVYLGWHEWNYSTRGYWSGNAGGINYTAFALAQPGDCLVRMITHDTSFGTWVDPTSGSVQFCCAAGGCYDAPLWTDGAYTKYTGAGQSLKAVKSGFVIDTNGLMRTAPAVTYATGVEPYVDVLNGEPLYVKGGSIYRATTALATLAALFGSGTMRPIFTRGDRDEIVVASGIWKDSPDQFIVCTVDAFVNYYDKSGNYWVDVDNRWDGDSADAQYYQNAQVLAFPYSDEDYP